MNGIQNRKGQNIEKFPGCLGRMVNLFDLNTGVPGNRLLTDKPHQNGDPLSMKNIVLLSNYFEVWTFAFHIGMIWGELFPILSNDQTIYGMVPVISTCSCIFPFNWCNLWNSVKCHLGKWTAAYTFIFSYKIWKKIYFLWVCCSSSCWLP